MQKNKNNNWFLTAIAAILLPLTATEAKANTATVNGITWTFTVSNGKATLGSSSSYAVPESTSGEITIPSSLGGSSVTEIGKSAFANHKQITAVTIPNSVTSIGEKAFYSCDSLTSMVIPNSVTSIGDNAFMYCEGLTFVNIGNRVRSIGAKMFYGCKALESVTIGDHVTSIGEQGFFSCSNLKSVTIPTSVTSIGKQAFSGCSNLVSVTIPDSVTSIAPDAFNSCQLLWANWYRTMNGDVPPPDPRYALASGAADRSIATVTVNGNQTIDTFVLADGKVFDMVLRVINVASTPSTLTLPAGYTYEQLKGTEPLTIPALSTNLLTITRTADNVFFVAREELEPAQ